MNVIIRFYWLVILVVVFGFCDVNIDDLNNWLMSNILWYMIW